MKVLALALVLLAVGAHAASIETMRPVWLDQFRSFLDLATTQSKDVLVRSVNQLDGPEYEELKVNLIANIDNLHARIMAMRASAAPVTDSILTTLADATVELRTNIEADFEALKVDLAPKRVALQEVIERHIREYREKIEPIITEYSAKHEAEMEILKAKLGPVLTELHGMIATNVEETKTALMPMVESVRDKVSERLEQLKMMASPYVEEYKEQLKKAYNQAQSVNFAEIGTLKEKIQPLTDEINLKLAAIFEIVNTYVHSH